MSLNDQQTWAGSAGGTGNAITLTVPNVTSLADLIGVNIGFTVTNTNSGATTITVSGVTAAAVKKNSSAGLVALTGGEFIATNMASAKCNGTVFVITSPPPPVTASANTIQSFTTSGTYTPSVGVQRVYVQAWGGGGGGFSVGSGSHHAGDGGGGGEYRFGVFSVTPGVGLAVTIGAGGAANSNGQNTSFDSLVTANGGHGATSFHGFGPGAGGTGGTGGVGIPGYAGNGGFTDAANDNFSGNGGASFCTSLGIGNSAGNFPGGGGGGGNGGSGPGTGGAGAAGFVTVQELLN